MTPTYKQFENLHLPSIEKEILDYWETQEIFKKSITTREGSKPFVFYEGPPSANGMPGIHHVISRTIKDIFCRYKTMQGFQVNRKGGWDTHGLPVELGVEKELNITKEDVGKKISIEEYNKKCKEAVLRYKDKWDELTRKMGYWVDLNHPYITFTNEYIESLWWLLKKMYDKGLLYKDLTIQPYSPAAGTGLSSHELNQPGTYKMVKDISCIAQFELERNEKSAFLFDSIIKDWKKITGGNLSNIEIKHNHETIYLLAWTTTPWTLPSNLGLAVGEGIDYVLIRICNQYDSNNYIYIILATNLVEKYINRAKDKIGMPIEEGECRLESIEGDGGFTNKKCDIYWIIKIFKGRDIVGCRYKQLLPYPANEEKKTQGLPFRIVSGDFVTTEDGTGIVHIAPAFGADDFKVGKQYNLGMLNLVDREGKFVEGLGDLSGKFVKNYKDDPDYKKNDVNKLICDILKEKGQLFKHELYEHSYPHCWRTDKPILYYPLDAWFIRTTAYKDRMIELNKTIQWKPIATGEGRFGNWLENMVDWNISRSRCWGTPLPIWQTDDQLERICIGSIKQLKEEMEKAKHLNNERALHISDLHRPFIDEVILLSDAGKPMKRVHDLVDVWFDSGAMPFAQWHFPFENKDIFIKNYPADFICEGVDQTRGWFYTLHAISSLVKEEIEQETNMNIGTLKGNAFATVVSNGLVLDKKGNKMSKRIGNVIDPFKTIETYSADATRWYLITNASPWDNLKFDIEGIEEVQRKFFGTLYNTYQFFVLYANLDTFSFKENYIPIQQRPEMDRWILSCLHSLIEQVTKQMDIYEPTQAGRHIEDFIDHYLSNWYVRLNRRRYWKGQYSEDKIAAYQTLYECIETLLFLIAPIAPFFSDALFIELNKVSKRFNQPSIHLCKFPEATTAYINKSLENKMLLAMDISSLVLSIRKKINIKVRQPLQTIKIPITDVALKRNVEQVKNIILNEVNVKEIEYISELTMMQKKIKPKFTVLGKKYGNLMKDISIALANASKEDIIKLEKNGFMGITIQNKKIDIDIKEVEIQVQDIEGGWHIASKGSLTIALDTIITPQLKEEGDAREFINKIQNFRKEQNFNITDKIIVKIEKSPSVISYFSNNKLYICTEILAKDIEWVDVLENSFDLNINEIMLKVSISKDL